MSPSAAVLESLGPEPITPSQGPLRAPRNHALDATLAPIAGWPEVLRTTPSLSAAAIQSSSG
jgi:hypothetical protein